MSVGIQGQGGAAVLVSAIAKGFAKALLGLPMAIAKGAKELFLALAGSVGTLGASLLALMLALVGGAGVHKAAGKSLRVPPMFVIRKEDDDEGGEFHDGILLQHAVYRAHQGDLPAY